MAELMNPEEFLRQTEGVTAPLVPEPKSGLLSPDEFLKQTEFVEYQGLGPTVAALGAGALRGVTFGLSDVAGRALGLGEELAKLKKYQPGISLTGELTGAIAPTLLSGGVGGVATAARLASAPVRAVAKAGQLAEGALARQFVSEAAKSSARKVLEGAATKGLGSAIEGLAYGAGQIVSEAALGDPKQVAENAVATLGLSAVLGGSLGAGAKIAGALVKGTAETLKPQLKNLKQNLVGISDDAAKTILEKPEAVRDLAKYGDDVDEIFSNFAAEKAAEASTARYDLIESVRNNVANLIEKNGLTGKAVPVSSLLKAMDETRKRISPRGRAVTQEVSSTLNKLDDIEADFLSYVRQSAGLKDDLPLPEVRKLIEGDDLKLNAFDLNDLKSQYYASTKDAFLVGKSDPINSLYERLGSVSNKALDAIDPSIREANAKLSNSLKAQESLKNLGLFDRYEFDANKFKRVFAAKGDKWVEYKKALEVLDENWGTNLVESAELGRAYKELFPKDVISRYFSGRALLAPTVGGAAGALLGGPIGAAAGALGSAALASPLATELKLRAANAAENVIKSKLIPAGQKLGQMNKYIPENLAPFVNAQISALLVLERQNQKVDRQINSAINGFVREDALEPAPTSMDTLRETSFVKPYSKSLDNRIDAFNERLSEIIEAGQNLESLNDRIVKNTKAVNYVAPEVAQNMLAKGIEATQFLLSKAPKNRVIDNLQPQRTDWQPSDAELAKFERYVEAVENPLAIFKDLKSGIITNEQVETLRTIYPGIYDKLVLGIREQVAKSKKPLSYAKKNQLAILFQQPLTQLHQPQVLAMLQKPIQEAQMPQGSPRFSAQSRKLVLNNLTETQRIEAGEG
jgi:hypothetical protein